MNGKYIGIAIIMALAALGGFGYVLVSLSTGDGPAPSVARIPTYNICMLVDLSDRISKPKAPNQVFKDKLAIRMIVEVFDSMVRRKLYIGSKDILRLEVAPQPMNYDSSLFRIGGNLCIDMTHLKASEKREKYQLLRTGFLASVDSLYAKASTASRFPGADIW